MAYGQQAKPQTRTTASGVQVQTMDIQGKQYVTVAARIAEANVSDMTPRFSILSTEFKEYGGIHMCQMTIEVNGKQFIGTSTLNLGATKGIDAKAALENSETSALGRALGLAGFGSLESVASAEEVINAINREGNGNTGKPQGNGNANGQGTKPNQQSTQQPAAAADLIKQIQAMSEKLLAYDKGKQDQIDKVVNGYAKTGLDKASAATLITILDWLTKDYLLHCIQDSIANDLPPGENVKRTTALEKVQDTFGTTLFSSELSSSNEALKVPETTLRALLTFIQQSAA